MFELLLYSSKLGGFRQWFDCFTILFDVSSVSLMEEYENLEAMVDIEQGDEIKFNMSDGSQMNLTWINALKSKNSR